MENGKVIELYLKQTWHDDYPYETKAGKKTQ